MKIYENVTRILCRLLGFELRILLSENLPWKTLEKHSWFPRDFSAIISTQKNTHNPKKYCIFVNFHLHSIRHINQPRKEMIILQQIFVRMMLCKLLLIEMFINRNWIVSIDLLKTQLIDRKIDYQREKQQHLKILSFRSI